MAKKVCRYFRPMKQSGKNKSPGDLFFPELEKQVPRGLVFATSGKNKSPGDLFLPVLEKPVPRGLVFASSKKLDFTFVYVRSDSAQVISAVADPLMHYSSSAA